MSKILRFKGANAPKYRFTNKTATAAEILLYGPIGRDMFGEGISAKAFDKQLKALGNPRSIELRIDSPGGSVFEGRTIYTRLAQHRARINVRIDGVAASAASFIAMAGDEIHIAEGGFFMIHDASAITMGNKEEHRKTLALLETVDDTILQTYVARTGLSAKQIREWMAAEKWFTGAEAKEFGFADEIMENKKIAACAYPDAFRNLPKQIDPRVIRVAAAREKMKGILENVQ